MRKQLYVHPWFKKEEQFSLNCVDSIENHLSKPDGGLWTSTFNEEFGSEWLKSEFIEFKEGMKGYIFEVFDDANILYVDSLEIANIVAKEYFVERVMTTSVYDFEKMSLEYDAINLKGEALSRHSPFSEWYIESTLWFNVKKLRIIDMVDVYSQYYRK